MIYLFCNKISQYVHLIILYIIFILLKWNMGFEKVSPKTVFRKTFVLESYALNLCDVYTHLYSMSESSNGNILHVTGPLWGESTSHQWLSHHKAQWCWALMFSSICAWAKQLSKQLRRWCLEMPLHSLWCHCNVLKLLHGIGVSSVISWTTAALLWNGLSRTNVSHILIKIWTFQLRKCIWNYSLQNVDLYASLSVSRWHFYIHILCCCTLWTYKR